MPEKIYEFKITQPLTAVRRKAIGKLIDENAHRSPWPITWSWDGDSLHVTSQPMNIDVIFSPGKIEAYRSSPFWARMLITKKKQEQMQGSIVKILKDLGFFDAPKTRKKTK